MDFGKNYIRIFSACALLNVLTALILYSIFSNRNQEIKDALNEFKLKVSDYHENNGREGGGLSSISPTSEDQITFEDQIRAKVEASIKRTEEESRSGLAVGLKFNRSPEYQEYITIDKINSINEIYAALWGKLDLSEEEIEHLKDSLIELGLVSKYYVRSNQEFSDYTKVEIADLQTFIRSEIDEEIRSLIGLNNYAEYKHHNQTYRYRNGLRKMTEPLWHGDNPITPAQFEEVIDIYAEVKEPYLDGNGAVPIGESIEDIETQYNMVLEEASSVLDEKQLNVLKNIFYDRIFLETKRRKIIQ